MRGAAPAGWPADRRGEELWKDNPGCEDSNARTADFLKTAGASGETESAEI
jgi:hypothetical protein